MESLVAFPDGEWDSFNKLFSIEDQLDFSHPFLHQFSFPLENDEALSFINPASFFPNEIFMPCVNAFDSSFHYDSLQNHIGATNDINKITTSFPPAFPNTVNNVIEDNNELLLKRNEFHAQGQGDKISCSSSENTKKRARVSKDVSSTTCSSEDDSVSQAQETTKGKTRASRGTATDPQSLYARKRRERINERLRILQNLVPNGTKVDISTMLEEAVYYVKFLQLQIKLLSSDDLWMYAPIAYNGVDVGLNKKISTLL
ncbi:hypothetical protein HRI_001409000 [Hibiscus trionum]|uniref:BHLH domain-containing protein n=1 Tax=Hibiscus trionum TaxID=183268 RepID=A0A9W7HIB1_HIBTR|nr:hypothetical protein HRI_001409000 [Hibiscus trionum]